MTQPIPLTPEILAGLREFVSSLGAEPTMDIGYSRTHKGVYLSGIAGKAGSRAMMIYSALKVHANYRNAPHWPSIRFLADQCGMSVTAVMVSIDRLIENELLKVTRVGMRLSYTILDREDSESGGLVVVEYEPPEECRRDWTPKERAASCVHAPKERPHHARTRKLYDVDPIPGWSKLRVFVLKRDGSRCACCGASPATGAVMHVDHIKPRALFPELAADPDNMQVLCSDCNLGKSDWDQTDFRR